MHKGLLWAGVAAAASASTLWVPHALQQLTYSRPAIANGELHRLLTAHLVHVDARHLLLDLAALGVTAVLVGRDLEPSRWLALLALSAFGTSLAIYVLSPATTAFAGLSAVVHAALAGGAVARLRRAAGGADWLGAGLAAGLVAKLVFERSDLTLVRAVAGSPAVAADAHLYASLAGAALGAWFARPALRHAATSAASASAQSAGGPNPASSTLSSANTPARPASEV